MTQKQKLQLFALCFVVFISILIIQNRKQAVTIESIQSNETESRPVCSTLQSQSIRPLISFSGRVKSANKINILSEVNGLSKINNSRFEVGERFKKGDVLLSIHDEDLALELKSIKSQFLTLLVQVLPDLKMDFPDLAKQIEYYVNNFHLDGTLAELPIMNNSKEKTFFSSKQIFFNYYRIKSLENKLEKFNIQAPFDGILTKTLLDPGSNVIMGQPIGEFINLNDYELNTSVSVQEASVIREGDHVLIESDDFNNEVTGLVKRIGSHINELTQSVDVVVSIETGDVIDGMYVSGHITCNLIENIFTIERSKIINNNKIYILNNNILREKLINIVVFQNDSVIIEGLTQQDCVLDEYRHYFYDGMNIK